MLPGDEYEVRWGKTLKQIYHLEAPSYLVKRNDVLHGTHIDNYLQRKLSHKERLNEGNLIHNTQQGKRDSQVRVVSFCHIT